VLFTGCPPDAAFYELDPETGFVSAVESEENPQGGLQSPPGRLINAPLCPWSARIFVMAKPGEEESGVLTTVQTFTRGTLRLKLDLDEKLPVSVQGDNVYRLEEMTVSIDGGIHFLSKPNTFIEHLRESGSIGSAKIKFDDGFGLPRRLSVNYPIQASYNFQFTLAANLFSECAPLKVRLLRDRMGIMGGHSFVINSRELPADCWKSCRVYDQNNIAADITAFLREGANSLDISVTATEDWHGLSDPMYPLGNFGVFRKDGKFIIDKAPSSAIPGARAVYGYPFYSGKFRFKTLLFADNPGSHELFTVELPEKYRIYECTELSINGQKLGTRVFSPYVWQGPVTLLKNGANAVELTIANTLGNMLEGCYFDYEKQKTVFITDEQ
jgi:hypothetical protein